MSTVASVPVTSNQLLTRKTRSVGICSHSSVDGGTARSHFSLEFCCS